MVFYIFKIYLILQFLKLHTQIIFFLHINVFQYCLLFRILKRKFKIVDFNDLKCFNFKDLKIHTILTLLSSSLTQILYVFSEDLNKDYYIGHSVIVDIKGQILF